MDSAVTHSDGTAVRSHPRLLKGKLRSTTASCDTTAMSRRALAKVVVTT